MGDLYRTSGDECGIYFVLRAGVECQGSGRVYKREGGRERKREGEREDREEGSRPLSFQSELSILYTKQEGWLTIGSGLR